MRTHRKPVEGKAGNRQRSAPGREAGRAQGRRAPLQLPLFGILLLCCSCSRLKLRGKWTGRIVRSSDYPKTEFSHGICPSCLKRLYPEVARNKARARRRIKGTTPKAPDR